MSKHFPGSQRKQQLTSNGKKQAKEKRNRGVESSQVMNQKAV